MGIAEFNPHLFYPKREKNTFAKCHRTLLCPKKRTSVEQYNPRFSQQRYLTGSTTKVQLNIRICDATLFFSPLRESDKLLPEFPSALNTHCHIAEDMRSHFHIHRWESLSFSRDDCWRVPSTKSFPCTQTTLLLPKWISSTHISYFPHFNLMFRVSYIYPTPVTFLIRRLLLPSLFILFPSRKWHLDVVNTARWN